MQWLPEYQHLCNATLTKFLDARYEDVLLDGSERTFVEAIRYGIE